MPIAVLPTVQFWKPVPYPSPAPHRADIDTALAAIKRAMPAFGGLRIGRYWSGMLDISPDGLPIIDRHPVLANVFFAGGYSMLGMTLAAPAAEKLAEFVMTNRRPPELAPFRATRFRRVAAG